ncbi:bloodthirsty-related gene family, member 2 [Chanos chanos]|uniref:Bloodthirsty-related gene family, member 2 n=1 Tax=Chanos chanos TaxID=29144 RepID=A0A6J2WQR1_CHACN|nr:E3 ubiquitin-protein ligase TRIM39-like [Chanos chanos]
MASTISLLSEKHFLCSLCEDIFSSPVTTPCGHSFCKVCLRKYWSHRETECCPLCKKTLSPRPHLSVNRILADVTENYRKTREFSKSKAHSEDIRAPAKRTEEMVQQMIQERLQKMEKLQNSLKLLKSSCLREVRESHQIFSALVVSLEKSHKAVVAAVEERQREAERRVERLVKELEKEIVDLKREQSELKDQQLNHIQDIKRSLQHIPMEMRDWSTVTMETEPCVGFTRRAVEELLDTLQAEVNKLSKSELKRLQRYSADITLNPRTAHACLYLSEDRKQVRHCDKKQEVPENPKRFDRVANVLGKESFNTGRHYWEVEVEQKSEWDLGIARQSVNRKGKFTLSPINGYWTVSLRNGCEYIANTSPPTSLRPCCKPRRVAIYLDYEEGKVSFYCVETGVHIYTFTDTFTDRLHPILSPGRPHGSRNIAPLVITSNCCSI